MADVLVIDDHPGMRRLVARILRSAGHAVTEAEGGTQGLSLFRRSQPALVITDIIMENGEGIETILEMRREAPEMPILAMSGSGLLFLQAAGQLGASATIEKPFNSDEFIATVTSLLPR